MADTCQRPSTSSSRSLSSLGDDIQDMCALGGFMFLINELRDLAQGKRVKSKDPQEAEMRREQNRRSFEQIMTFPIQIVDIESIILENKTVLVKIQGEERYQFHLDMCSFLLRSACDTLNNDIEGVESYVGGPTFLNYTDQATHDAVYSIVMDHIRKRIIVVFRGSVTKEDWAANLSVSQSKIANPQYAFHNKCNGTYMKIHKGFYNYLFQPIGDKETTGTKTRLFDVIVKDVISKLKQHPNYDVFTTGISLGGALTTVFAFFFAADTKLPKITCYSFASPKLGNIAFRRACQNYEYNGRLRLLRVANQNDPVVSLPRRMLTMCPCFLVCPSFTYLAMFCTCFVQTSTYRHVGMGLQLPEKSQDLATFVHTRLNNKMSCFRILCSDWVKLFARECLLYFQYISNLDPSCPDSTQHKCIKIFIEINNPSQVVANSQDSVHMLQSNSLQRLPWIPSLLATSPIPPIRLRRVVIKWFVR